MATARTAAGKGGHMWGAKRGAAWVSCTTAAVESISWLTEIAVRYLWVIVQGMEGKMWVRGMRKWVCDSMAQL